MSRDLLVRLLGWRGAILHADTALADRQRWLSHNLTPGRLTTLDAGCGSGGLAMYAASIGNTVTAISFDEANNQKGRRRAALLGLDVEFLAHDLRRLEELDERLGQFDQVLCFETIEHILGDVKLIHDLSELIKINGRILLTTPYKFYRKLPTDVLSAVEDGGHVRWGYTHEEVRELFEGHGIEVIVEDWATGFLSQKLISLYRALCKKNVLLGVAVTMPLRALLVLDPAITWLLRYPYLSIAVVGVKRAPARR